jgi:hypothetical protein
LEDSLAYREVVLSVREKGELNLEKKTNRIKISNISALLGERDL